MAGEAFRCAWKDRLLLPQTSELCKICRLVGSRSHQAILWIMLSFLATICSLEGQSPSQAPSNPSAASQVPLSGRTTLQPGTVSVNQSTTNTGGANSAIVINSSVNVQPPFSGSTSNGTKNGSVLPLTLEQALNLGLKLNLGNITQSETLHQSEGQRLVARSSLLPNLNTVVSEEVEQLNLATVGVSFPGIPKIVQFNFFDARAARLTQAVFDFIRLQNLHSASANVKAALESVRNARDLVVLAVGGSYLQLIATEARIGAAAAQVETSRAVYQQAADRLSAGLNARIDATRSQVQLQTDEERLRALRADLDKQKLSLARIIGLPRGQQFSVVGTFPYTALSGLTVDSALDRAYASRADLRAAAEGVRAAEASVKAARAERLPYLNLTADYGAAGLRPTASAHGVYSVYGTLTIPLYEGGRVHGDIEQAEAALRNRKAEEEDLRGQVDQDVREAFINLDEAADQVELARSNQNLAHDTLTQARDRFTAGIADTVELVQAEQTVVQADNDFISAIFEHNLAKISLARSIGAAEHSILQFLKP